MQIILKGRAEDRKLDEYFRKVKGRNPSRGEQQPLFLKHLTKTASLTPYFAMIFFALKDSLRPS